MHETDTPEKVGSNDGLGVWSPIDAVSACGVVLLTAQDSEGERRTFVAEISRNGATGKSEWFITRGCAGWKKLHSGWNPILWMPLPQAPNAEEQTNAQN